MNFNDRSHLHVSYKRYYANCFPDTEWLCVFIFARLRREQNTPRQVDFVPNYEPVLAVLCPVRFEWLVIVLIPRSEAPRGDRGGSCV